jgi:hypothetical protein
VPLFSCLHDFVRVLSFRNERNAARFLHRRSVL